MASPCEAGVWGADPLIGVIGDYATNPSLLGLEHTAEARAALLIDVPATYVGDAFTFSLQPRLRFGDSPGYSTTTSDYEHLDAKGEWDTERGMLDLTGGIGRDSSLYHDYIFNGSAGVERESASAGINWNRRLTERTAVDTDIATSRVRYGASRGAPTLTDYSYSSITPTLAWDESEKGKLTAAASAGFYQSLDRTTKSTNANLQLGFQRRLTELWTLTATAGYSRAFSTLDTFTEQLVLTPYGLGFELVPETIKSTQSGTVFSVNASRQASRWLLTAVASRQLVPSGFAYLSRQQLYQATASYPCSDRWTLSADARYMNSQDPALTGAVIDRTIRYAGVSSAWRWTENWTITWNASRVQETVRPPGAGVGSTELSLELSRQFNRIRF